MTPAIDMVKKKQLAFYIHQYSPDANANAFGEEAADKLGISHERVFKTLVLSNPEGELAVAVVPVSVKLSMKKMAKALDWKKVAMADKLTVRRSTGYVLGGVSPLGQKKALVTVIDDTGSKFSTIFISAGKRGLEIELSPHDLALLVPASFADIGER
ncbi:MAG: Cys-tRNA(Pro)/Cys-tRNA(Cys) deacylase [Alphaproteobacteria bacterium]|jgi:Cys-tRNA(Pro)/Cys-tRNA(Cys) deacylase